MAYIIFERKNVKLYCIKHTLLVLRYYIEQMLLVLSSDNANLGDFYFHLFILILKILPVKYVQIINSKLFLQ